MRLLCGDLMDVSRTAVETLLERGFVPSRTVLLAFGSDEEAGGGSVRHVSYQCPTRAKVVVGRKCDRETSSRNLRT